MACKGSMDTGQSRWPNISLDIQHSELENGFWKRGANAYPLISRILTF
jgi:hypothetical protein